MLAEGKFLREAIVQGSLEGFNPILMTALVAAVICGWVTSTLLTLFILAVVYKWVEAKREKKFSS